MSHIFDKIENGMPVVQADNEKIGEVEYIKYGEGITANDASNTAIVDLLAEALGQATFPEEVNSKLQTNGFMRVERGLQSDAFVFPSQIEQVEEGTVHINVTQDDLLTG